jgi:hypothetical protein
MNKIFCVLIVLGQRYFMDKISLVFENITMWRVCMYFCDTGT